jgi:hypothetical protein
VEPQPTNRRTSPDEDTQAAILALAHTRETQRVLMTLLRVGETRAVYEGPSDPAARRRVEHYKFYTPQPDQQRAALSADELQSYRAYDHGMMAASLQSLCDATERLRQAHADVQLSEHEYDIVDWSAGRQQIGAIEAACDDVLSLFNDEFLPHLEALSQLAELRCREMTLLDTAISMPTASCES